MLSDGYEVDHVLPAELGDILWRKMKVLDLSAVFLNSYAYAIQTALVYFSFFLQYSIVDVTLELEKSWCYQTGICPNNECMFPAVQHIYWQSADRNAPSELTTTGLS